MCDELLRCFRRRSAKVESFWPGAEPASLPRGCSLIKTCCMHPHARRTHILSHALKHPSHGAVTRLVLRSPRFPNYILHIQLWIDFLRRAASSVPPHSEEEAVGTVGSGKRQAAFFKDVTGVALYFPDCQQISWKDDTKKLAVELQIFWSVGFCCRTHGCKIPPPNIRFRCHKHLQKVLTSH